ncbi:MAG: pectin esterase, partial [Candidatus Methanofastidiosa archaeon]|nr:pectin esterase [Candidatus Methanofastidiosa archaeon]
MKIVQILFLFVLTSTFVKAQDKYQFIVSKDGTGDYTTIQSAIDACKAFPDNKILIFVKNGIYHEKITVLSCNTHLIIRGESAENTIITWNDYFAKINRGRNSTFYTWTLKIEASDFSLENITVANNAGPVGQAIALHVEGDRCVFKNCRILGFQDTLYAAGDGSRQYYLNCYIEGTTDFIFGEATALFDHCIIHSKSDSYITAASTPKKSKFGFVFLDCKLTSEQNVLQAYLGRPWRDYARVVYIRCEIGKHIDPPGWKNWDKTERYKTAYFAEYGNYGPGANTSERISWAKMLNKRKASKYTSKYILKGCDGWQPE